jgi:uncharacterized protein
MRERGESRAAHPLHLRCEPMTISENAADGLSIQERAWPVPAGAIAPSWHTALVIVVILGVSALSSLQAKSERLGQHHLKNYALTMAWEAALAVLVWWGTRIRRVPLRQLLGKRRDGAKAWFTDLGIALIFWVMAAIVLAAIATVLRLAHLMQAQKAVMELAPGSIWEIALWVALSVTAGIVEEFVFRGYLLQQFASIGGRLWLGVLASSLLFGAAHGYEGIGAMIVITAYGAMFCVLTIQRESMRAGMIAHAWHDSITGIFLAIAKHLRMI